MPTATLMLPAAATAPPPRLSILSRFLAVHRVVFVCGDLRGGERCARLGVARGGRQSLDPATALGLARGPTSTPLTSTPGSTCQSDTCFSSSCLPAPQGLRLHLPIEGGCRGSPPSGP